MPKDILEIVDTAVKIGLGALISGMATYWVTRLNHNKAIEKDRSERRRQMIEDVAENIERLFALLFSFRAGIHDWINAREHGSNLSEERYENVLSEQTQLPKAYKEITSSEATLLLIGEKKAQKLIREFGHAVSEKRKMFRLGNSTLTIEDAEDFRSMLLEHREIIFNELSSIFSK